MVFLPFFTLYLSHGKVLPSSIGSNTVVAATADLIRLSRDELVIVKSFQIVLWYEMRCTGVDGDEEEG